MVRFHFETYPGRYVDLIYFETTNGKKIVDLLRAGKLNAGFVNANLIIDYFQLQVACVAALAAAQASTMATHNLHSEVVYRLSPNRNITQSFRTFGLDGLDGSDRGYLLLFDAHADTLANLAALLELTLHETHVPQQTADTAAIRKLYGVNQVEAAEGNHPALVDAVATRIATKGL